MDVALQAQVRAARGKFAAMAGSYFLGTFNDNFYKQAVMLLAVAAGREGLQSLAAAAFTLPFVLFAAPAGWMADRFSKRTVVVAAKTTELLAAMVGAAGFLTGQLWLMVGMVGLMGLQSTFFSPALNGSIPELYPESQVTQANGVLRMLVTVGILLGTALSGICLDLTGAGFLGVDRGRATVAVMVLVIGAIGLLVSLGIPRRPAADPARPFPWSGPLETFRELKRIFEDRLLGRILWADVFVWALGTLQLLVINPLGLRQLGYSKERTSFLLAAQLVGLGLGGLLAGRLAKGERWYRVLVPAGVATALVMGAMGTVPMVNEGVRLPLVLGLLGLMGLFGGMVLVPCESFLQVRPAPERKGAVWASGNFASFSGMVVASLLSGVLNTHFRPTTVFVFLGVGSLLFFLWLRAALAEDLK